MDPARPSHHDSGLHRILNRAAAYGMLQKLLLRGGSRERYVREFVRPFEGCRVLDIGCGPADILEHLPASIGEYAGFDMNPAYIEAAQRRWGGRGRFRCEKVDAAVAGARGHFDIVLATGIVHHLDDAEARTLFAIGRQSLRPGGRLVTYDNVYIDNQHWLARWLIAHDRGKAVRTREAYETLARGSFRQVECQILHDTLRVPYTILVMSCVKSADRASDAVPS